MRILSKGKQRRRRLPVVPAVLLSMATLLGVCGGDSIVGPAAEACGPQPYLTVLPVTEAELSSVPVFGGLDAPGHVLPTAHGGLFLTRENVQKLGGARHRARTLTGTALTRGY